MVLLQMEFVQALIGDDIKLITTNKPADDIFNVVTVCAMVCCLLCFDDSPVGGDPRAGYGNRWEIGMMEAPLQAPGASAIVY